MTRLEYALSLGEGEEVGMVLGDARDTLDGVGVGGIFGFLEKRPGEEDTFGSLGERLQRSGDDDRGDDTAGV